MGIRSGRKPCSQSAGGVSRVRDGYTVGKVLRKRDRISSVLGVVGI